MRSRHPGARARGRRGARPVVERDVAVPMRDGVVLRADVLRPDGAGRSRCSSIARPTARGRRRTDYPTFAKAVARGYAVVVQDVRGRYASDGEFDPYAQEGRTATTRSSGPRAAVVERAVGTFGLSYPGAVQWLAAVESPPHLEAMVPAMTFATPRNFFFYAAASSTCRGSRGSGTNIAPDVRAPQEPAGPAHRRGGRGDLGGAREDALGTCRSPRSRSFETMAPYYFEWMRAPAVGSLVGLGGAARQVRPRTSAAVLNLSGWHDEAYGPDGATTNFSGLNGLARGAADPRTALLMGPWLHGVGWTARPEGGRPRVRAGRGDRLRRGRAAAGWTATCAASRTASSASRPCARS